MKNKTTGVVSISYAKRALESGSREYLRMKQYAALLGELHIIVFSSSAENFPLVQQDENLFLYATNSLTKIGKILTAIKIGKKIIRKKTGLNWVVSSQDPFETSVVGRAVARGNRTPHHIQIHGDIFNPLSSNYSILQKIRTIYGKKIVKKATRIRVVSERIKNSLIRLGVRAEVVSVFPIQADLKTFIEVGERRTYNPDKNPSFLYVGRFSEEKNLPLLIKSFANITKEFPQANLTLLGDGPLKSLVKSEISKLNVKSNVSVLAWTDDVTTIMSEHDILCLSSNHEGWAMVLLEAAASGMPVITTDVGCAGEFIKDGVQGSVVPVDSEAEYTKAMLKYLEDTDLVSKHGQSGLQSVKTNKQTEDEYIQNIVNDWSACWQPNPAILSVNG